MRRFLAEVAFICLQESSAVIDVISAASTRRVLKVPVDCISRRFAESPAVPILVNQFVARMLSPRIFPLPCVLPPAHLGDQTTPKRQFALVGGISSSPSTFPRVSRTSFIGGIEPIRSCRRHARARVMHPHADALLEHHVRTTTVLALRARATLVAAFVDAACGFSLIRKKNRAREKPSRASELSVWRSAALLGARGLVNIHFRR